MQLPRIRLTFTLSRGLWPQLRPWMRDGLLLLALLLALTSIDAPAGLARLWWSMPLALVAIALTLAGPEGRPWRMRHLAVALLIAFTLGARAWASIVGPVPLYGVREAMELGVVLVLSIALWQTAAGDGRRIMALWSVALAAGCGVESLIALLQDAEAEALAARSVVAASAGAGRIAMGLSALTGFILLALERRHIDLRHAPADARHDPATPMLRAAMLVVGLLLGVWFGRLPHRIAFEQELGTLAGRTALQDLWLQSLLIGWGRHALGPLSQVVAQPHAALFQAWNGVWGLLATGGLLGVGLMILVCVALIVRRKGAPAPSPVPPGATGTALLIGGLILGGGPLSGAVLLTFSGWSALSLARPRRRAETARGWDAGTILATGFAALGMLLLVFVLHMPVRSDRLLAASARSTRTLDERQYLLARAQALNPYNPEVPLKLASVLRDRMDVTPGWSESLYRAVMQAYERAQKLDPYEELYAMNQADFQLRCAREDEAIATIEAAIQRKPYDIELCLWLYLASRRLDRTQDAYRMLDRGLRIQPTNPMWWQEQYLIASAAGQTALAERSLSVALTADAENAQLIAEAWQRRRAAASTPEVHLPQRPGR